MLRKDVCESNSFAKINNSNAQLLFILLTPWWDDYGKMIGDPIWIQGNIVRKLPQFNIKVINWCLLRISECADVVWWTDEKGNKWLHWKKFASHQTISDEKRHKDSLPSPKIPKNPQESSVIRRREVKIRRREGADAQLSYEDFLKTLKTNQVYKGIDIDRELGKMDNWLLIHPGRQKTRRFIVAWLNRIDVPLQPQKKIEPKATPKEKFDPAEHAKVSALIHQTAEKMKAKGGSNC